MASLMEELLGVLEKEETEYLTLIDLADVKSQAIIKADIEAWRGDGEGAGGGEHPVKPVEQAHAGA